MEIISEEQSAISSTAAITNENHPNRRRQQRRERILQIYRDWKGVKPIPLIISLAIGLIVRFAIPKPSKVKTQGWQLLAIFLSTIVGLVVSPLPVGAWAFICLTVTIATKTLSFTEALSAVTYEVIWLIVVSFFFARGFIKTGLGERIAAYFVKWLGRSTVGMSYGLVISEAMIAPAMPSSTARAGGILCPIIKSLAVNANSLPRDKSAKKIGAYLIQSQLQLTAVKLQPWLVDIYFQLPLSLSVLCFQVKMVESSRTQTHVLSLSLSSTGRWTLEPSQLPLSLTRTTLTFLSLSAPLAMESFAVHSLSSTPISFNSSSRTTSLLHRRSRLPLPKLPSPNAVKTSASLSSTTLYSHQKIFLFHSHPLSRPLSTLKPLNSSPSSSNHSQLPPSSPPPATKLLPLIISVSIGLIVRFAIPRPVDVTPQAWQLLAIFLSTIVGLVLSPLPVGAWAFLGLTTSIATNTLPFTTAFSAFTSEVIWLIVISFFFARGFVKTGLGDRIATYFVKWLGKSTLGLSYGLTLGEALIAPAMPSTTARAGGVFLPIIKSLSLLAGSKPDDKSARKLGSYLIQSQFQSAGNSSALFLTAAAQNLLCLKLAEELGVKIASPWISWFKAASLPAIVALLVSPIVLYKIYPPETKDTPDAPAMATEKLRNMGPVTKNEWVMVGTMLLAVSLWVCGERIGVSSVVAAMLGLSVLLLLGVLDWDDCLSEKSAWDTLAWFAVLVGMAAQLTNLGIVSWMSGSVAKGLEALHLSWPAAFALLQAAYFFVHYLFASQTGHVAALYSAFLAMHLAAGVPGVLAALALAYNTNLFGALTHYSSGQAAVYYGAGYVNLPDVFKLGFIMALINATIWAVVGGFWWKILGLY
ncbi:hypothetical protein Ancab_027956 [Ancistrocladus abbreviatus]